MADVFQVVLAYFRLEWWLYSLVQQVIHVEFSEPRMFEDFLYTTFGAQSVIWILGQAMIDEVFAII